jgi:DNA-binding transcriptional ArsR family regulator
MRALTGRTSHWQRFDDLRTIAAMGAMAQSSAAGALPAPGLPPAETRPHPARHELDLASVLHALSDPLRLQIVADLADGAERTCKSFELPVVKSTCTHHFKVLREAGVIRQRLEGTTKLNSLRRQDLDAYFPGLLDAVLRSRIAPGAGRTPADASR